ncbi:hypothetical protein [Sphingomonas oryzagri]
MTVQSSTDSHAAIASPVFVSGSLSIGRLPFPVTSRLCTILDRRIPVLIGDARGADAAVQRFLADQASTDVTVYSADPMPRTNLGNWPIRVIPSEARKGTAAYHAGKDRAMAADAGSGFVIWDGRSRGSLANIHRLCARYCFIVVWLAQEESFLTLRSDAVREEFLKAHPCRVQ